MINKPQLQVFCFRFYFKSGKAENYGVARIWAESRDEAKMIFKQVFEYDEAGENLVSLKIPPNVHLIGSDNRPEWVAKAE